MSQNQLPAKTLPETLNWQQACQLLGCSRSHFYNLVNSGTIPAVRFGQKKGVKVKKTDCERFLLTWEERLEGKM